MTAVLGVLLVAAVLWKGYQLSRAPWDLPLRSVTLCLASAALAFPFGTKPGARAADAVLGAGAAELLQNVLLLCCVYFLMCFYLHSASDPELGSRRARLELIPLAVAVVLAALSVAATPPAERGGTYDTADMRIDGVAGFYLAAGLYLGYALAMALWWTRRYTLISRGSLATGLRLTAVSMAAMVLADAVRQAFVVVRWAGGTDESPVLTAANITLSVAIPVFVVGVSYPGVATRIAALRLWWRHRRAYRRLRPLWAALHQAFPEDELTRVPTRPWGDRLLLRGVHRRYYRRVIECRDGLVRISPYLAAPDEDSDVRRDTPGGEPPRPPEPADGWAPHLASRLRAALREHAAGEPAPSTATPSKAVWLPMPAEDTLEGDARQLVTLADAFHAAR
jgi:hypothetical protein